MNDFVILNIILGSSCVWCLFTTFRPKNIYKPDSLKLYLSIFAPFSIPVTLALMRCFL